MHKECCCFLLLFVIVCRMAKFVAGSLNLMPVFSFSSSKSDFLLMVPLDRTVSHLRPRCSVITAYGHARSQGGRQPAAANPPSYVNIRTFLSFFICVVEPCNDYQLMASRIVRRKPLFPPPPFSRL